MMWGLGTLAPGGGPAVLGADVLGAVVPPLPAAWVTVTGGVLLTAAVSVIVVVVVLPQELNTRMALGITSHRRPRARREDCVVNLFARAAGARPLP